MRRPVPEEINRPFGRRQNAQRRCAHPECAEAGAYRAPVSPAHLRDYYWFCLDHVRAYNRAWDYFAGMGEAEIERIRRADTVWQRPSWPLGCFGERGSVRGAYRVRDGFGFFAEDAARPCAPAPQTEEQKALAVLDLREPVNFADVKSRYKALVKELHPDANGGNREAEERLKIVNLAYAALKMSFA